MHYLFSTTGRLAHVDDPDAVYVEILDVVARLVPATPDVPAPFLSVSEGLHDYAFEVTTFWASENDAIQQGAALADAIDRVVNVTVTGGRAWRVIEREDLNPDPDGLQPEATAGASPAGPKIHGVPKVQGPTFANSKIH